LGLAISPIALLSVLFFLPACLAGGLPCCGECDQGGDDRCDSTEPGGRHE
jgi:hypothetical protein